MPPIEFGRFEICSDLIKPDTYLGGNIAILREVFNEKTT